MRVKKKKKVPNVYHCPHCNGIIEPGKLLYEKSLGLLTQQQTSEEMRRRVNMRWNRIRLFGR